MHRRRVLTAIGVSAATLSLAGCTTDLGTDGSDDETAGDDGSETETEDDEHESRDEHDDEANGSTDDGDESADGLEDEEDETDELAADDQPDALIESAEIELDAAGDEFSTALEETDDPVDDGTHAVETRSIDAHLDAAADDLSAARTDASSDQHETIEALEAVVEFFREFVAVFSALGDAMDEFERWEQYLAVDRWDDAVSAAEQADDYNDDAVERLTTARSTFDGIDTGALDGLDEVDRVEMEASLEEMAGALEMFDVLFTGSGQMAAAMEPFVEGADALEAERYDTAASRFSRASDGFDEAYRTFDEGEDDVPAAFHSDLIETGCEMDALGDATEYYALGSEALDDGEYERGYSYFAEGEAAAERCDNDEITLSLH